MDIYQLHKAEYETPPEIVVSAPGILYFLGEHTLGADGMILCAATDRRVRMAVSARKDMAVRFYTNDLKERKRTNIGNIKYKREDRWANLVKGPLSMILDQGVHGRGFNVTIAGDLPQGIGLGSSEALVVAASKAFLSMCGLPDGHDEVEQLCLRTEREYLCKGGEVVPRNVQVRAPASTIACVDTRNGKSEFIKVKTAGTTFALTDSKVPRPPMDDEIVSRTADFQTGVESLGGRKGGSLRDFGISDLEEQMGIMPESVRRHCLFLIEEVIRVKESREYLRNGDMAALGRLMNKSQSGLRNNFEISCPEVDWLAKRSLEIEGVHGSRMTGRGFGGAIVTVMASSVLEEYRKRLEDYERIFGFKAQMHEIGLGQGVTAE